MAKVTEALLDWFAEHKRDLPWRKTTDPYLVWVSEIILQQTQVKQGLPYYNRFVDKFPSVIDLANAEEDEILKLWQGLGYYSRARNMHFTAKYIVNELNGAFPDSYKELVKLKGIGEYTGAAISSFCFKEVVPVVDGNVYRFISRYFGINKPIDIPETKKEVRKICEEIISKAKPDDFNQAIMEFGALQCKPKQVDCSSCSLVYSCWAFQNKKVEELPFKSKKIKKRTRYFYYVMLESNNKTILRRRGGKDIWEGLYEFPYLEKEKSLSEKEVLKELELNGVTVNKISDYKKHILSHQTIHAKFFHLSVNDNQLKMRENSKAEFIHPVKEIDQFAFPKLIENYIVEQDF